ncbi:MAG: phosphotransferase family protein [Ilumatobacteraceae bacterium]
MRGIDTGRVSSWLETNVEGATPPFQFALIAGGRSNLTYAVTDAGGARYVVRRPPLGHVLATAHDMAREHRIVSAVGRTKVPVPPVYGLCTDVDVTGAPFYVMGFVDGVVLDGPDRASELPIALRPRLAEHLVDVLAELHDADVDEVGLGDLAKREGYVERQVKRWSTQWEQSKTRELTAIDEVARALRNDVPIQQGVSIVHGDFRFGNCLADVAAGRINAVLDWELCTLGDPLADVGYLGVYWYDGRTETVRPNDPTPAGGFPPYADMLERYARRTGRDVSRIGYYIAFGCWRLAVISEGVYARYLHGAMGDDVGVDVAAFKDATESLAERALAALREGL